VLILDEPTTGLDPNQLFEVRDLIKKVSKNKTVIFSTHIMQEVQAICDRAIIINKGKKVADQSIQDLLNQTSGQVLEVEFEKQVDLEIFKQLPEAHRLTELNELSVQFDFEANVDMRPVLMKFIAEHSLPLIGIKKRESSMEDVFNALTKSA
jgi:ABC-2 type transport system ATP-binding protein